MTPAENTAYQPDQFWLQQQPTLRMLAELERLHQEKLTQASRAARNTLTVSDVDLRLMLREASVLEEVINVITKGNQ